MTSPIAWGHLQAAAPCLSTERDEAGRVVPVRAFATLSAPAEGDERRGIPVPGTGRRRHGSYFRRPGTMHERRANALVLAEEGEVAARLVRCGSSLPSTWDDIYRSRERCWKAQHKGRKAWDRPPRAGPAKDTVFLGRCK